MTEYITKWNDELLDILESLNLTLIDLRHRQFLRQMSKAASLDILITKKQANYLKSLYYKEVIYEKK